MANTNPPAFQPHSIELVSTKDSQITNISLYATHAQATRLFRFQVKLGLNHVTIGGLPSALDKNSLKVEGTGDASIQDVTIPTIPSSTSQKKPTSEHLQSLLHKKNRTEQALQRCSLATKSLETYLGTMNVAVSDVSKILKSYQAAGEELDDQTNELSDELEKINADIAAETARLDEAGDNKQLGTKVILSLYAEGEGEIEIRLIYGVLGAYWFALYDVRVDTRAKEKLVELTYKASITQSTGEDWKDVDLVLETAEPMFGVKIPTLLPWNLSESEALPRAFALSSRMISTMDTEAAPSMKKRGIAPQVAKVASQGNVTATFSVPEKINIPSDGAVHTVTIAKLNLDATIRWVVVPKIQAKTHMSAKFVNASEYTLLSGEGSIYVNGSFIARTRIPLLGPEEIFDCPIGIDPSIKITYHPRSKKVTRSGFYKKTTTQVFTQRITIHNTKATDISDLKVTEQFPISTDSSIVVKNWTPALANVTTDSSGEIQIPNKMKLSPGVFAYWHGADDPDQDMESLGKDGSFDWICSVQAQKKVDLVLQYEIVAPAGTKVDGL